MSHGKAIIKEASGIVKKHRVKAAIKFQFRQLNTFIHPSHLRNTEHKQLKRFMSTQLDIDKYKILFNEVKENNLITMCTPFDEESADIIKDMNFDVIKVASCSAKDWPLLEKFQKLICR